MTGDKLPGENRILNEDDEELGDGYLWTGSSSWFGLMGSPPRREWVGGEGGGGGGVWVGQHQEFSGETIVGGSSFRVGLLLSLSKEEDKVVVVVVSRHLRRLGFVGCCWV